MPTLPLVRALVLLFATGTLTLAQSTPAPSPAAPAAPAAPWYRKARTFDVTGANPQDSVVLTATGPRGNRLAITMTFFAGGAPVYRQRWTGEDELYEHDDVRRSAARLDRFLRTRLDTVLTLLHREPINVEQADHMGDVAMLRRIRPRPTHSIVLSFGYETSVFLVWDPQKRRLAVFMECC